MRVFIRLIALLLLPLYLLAALPASGMAASKAADFTVFSDIPGVTEEEIAAIQALGAQSEPLIYGMLKTTETFIHEDGTYGGYSALFSEWMSALFGLRFEPRVYDWNELITGFESGEIHFTGELTATAQRRERYFMSDTFTERAIKAFRMTGSERLSAIARTRKLRYAFLEGTTTIDSVLAVSEYPVQPHYVATEEEAIALLRAGEVDAFLAEEHGAEIFPDDIVLEDIFPVIYSPISLSTTREELKPIIDVFDKALKNGAFVQLIDLYNRGYREYLQYKLISRLTPGEKEYLALHQLGGAPVSILVEYDTYPVSFYNKQESEWQGIALSVLDEISALSGIQFEIVNDTQADWATLLEMLETGEAAMVAELIPSSDRIGRFLWTDQPYTTDHYALISLTGHEDVSINQILYSRVGLIENTAYAEVFLEWFPDHQDLTVYPNVDAGFNALEAGEIDLLMAAKTLLLSATNYHENPAFKANLVFDKTYSSSFGFHKEEFLLKGIVEKAQALIDTDLISDRWQSKVFDYRSKLARQQVIYLFAGSVLLVLIIALLSLIVIRNRQMNGRLETTVRERTEELQIQTEMARTASQAKGDFLSRMSHEIRTPLNAIVGMAQIARQTAAQESPKTVHSIDEMISASSHLLGILNDVLDMSKIEAGKFTMAWEPFSLLRAMREVESIILPRLHEKHITFTTNLSAIHDAVLLGDKLRVNQVLINLLGNAAKFTDPGGEVGLHVEALCEDEATWTGRFEVRDDGIGMTEEQISRLFVAFEQAESNTASRYGGTGLGLAISQNLVIQMGGTIEVFSTPRRGSTFTFTLTFPLGDESVLPLGEESSEEALDFTGRRILLAEDIEINRLILMELLSDTGLEMDEATNGQEAVDCFCAAPVGTYDLIFMDIQMPVLDGYAAARAIRALQRPDAATVPIVAMTANAYREDIERALDAGMNGHVAKPIDIDAVRQMLKKHLNP